MMPILSTMSSVSRVPFSKFVTSNCLSRPKRCRGTSVNFLAHACIMPRQSLVLVEKILVHLEIFCHAGSLKAEVMHILHTKKKMTTSHQEIGGRICIYHTTPSHTPHLLSPDTQNIKRTIQLGRVPKCLLTRYNLWERRTRIPYQPLRRIVKSTKNLVLY